MPFSVCSGHHDWPEEFDVGATQASRRHHAVAGETGAVPPLDGETDCGLVCEDRLEEAFWSFGVPEATFRGTLTCALPFDADRAMILEVGPPGTPPSPSVGGAWHLDFGPFGFDGSGPELPDIEREREPLRLTWNACPAGQPRR